MYEPPKVWEFLAENGGQWASINRPTAGARNENLLRKGEHPLQLYSTATPNGQKVTILLEELLAAGVSDAEYDAWLIDITKGDQFSRGFFEINPNSKIPALVDYSVEKPIPVFESGSILLYLAEKFGRFIPKQIDERTRCLNWLFWLQGAAPFLAGGFGHFYSYAPEKYEYSINRYAMESKRLMDVLNLYFAENEYLSGEQYSIADIATWPWFGELALGNLYSAGEFLSVDSYSHLKRWAKQIESRSAVKRGRLVNNIWGERLPHLPERHSARDIDLVLGQSS